MAIYVLKQCEECGIVLRALPSEAIIGEAWTCPACQIIKREDWIKEIVDAVARGYRPQIGNGLVDLAKASYDEIKIEAGRVWSWHNAGAPVEQAQPEPLTGAQQVDPKAGGTEGHAVGGCSPLPPKRKTAAQFVADYCAAGGITVDEFYQTQIPMPDNTAPHGWAAVTNSPSHIKAHVDLYM